VLWDQEIREEVEDEVTKYPWIAKFEKLGPTRKVIESIKIHVVCDTKFTIYIARDYLGIDVKCGEVIVSLLIAKNAIIETRLMKYFESEIELLINRRFI
jgi:hypothetical protein